MIYLVFAPGRSGHHAIVNWICYQFPGVIERKGNYFSGWENGKAEEYGKKDYDIFKNEGNLNAELYSFENFRPKDFVQYDFENFDQFKGKNIVKIIMVRDPYNWLASTYKIKGVNKWAKDYITSQWTDMMGRKKESLLDIYKQLLREYIGTTNYFGNKIHINYNKWFESIVYRKFIADKIGLVFTDRGVNTMSKHAGGSSFDKRRKKPQKMNVLLRYKDYISDKYYLSMLDDEMDNISESVFGIQKIKR